MKKSVAILFHVAGRSRDAKLPFHVNELTYHETSTLRGLFKTFPVFFPLETQI